MGYPGSIPVVGLRKGVAREGGKSKRMEISLATIFLCLEIRLGATVRVCCWIHGWDTDI